MEVDTFWDGCSLVERVEGKVSGAPVLRDTRLPADALVGNVESFMELEGMTEQQAIDATLDCFPDTPGGRGYYSQAPRIPGGSLASLATLKMVLDEDVPKGLSEHLPGHDVHSVGSLGWKGTKNGSLLKLVESVSAEAFITADKSLEKQQVLAARPFRILMLSTNSWPLIQGHTVVIAKALEEAQLGTITKIDCGTFVPRRFRKAESNISE